MDRHHRLHALAPDRCCFSVAHFVPNRWISSPCAAASACARRVSARQGADFVAVPSSRRQGRRKVPLCVARNSRSGKEEAAFGSGDESRGSTHGAEKTLEQELDEIEAMATNRSPENEGKVFMFGAWLDDQAAGRKVIKSSSNSASDSLIIMEQRAFQRGVDLYNRGRYREAVTPFRAVIDSVGTGSRFGGEVGLWLAQAYDALGDKLTARQLLSTLKVHPDKDVKKVADELLYILQAPKLVLDERDMIQIPQLSEELHMKPKSKSKLSRGYGTAKPAYAVMEKGPEKYSIEWFLTQRTPAHDNSDDKMTVLVLGSCALMLLILLAGST